MENLSKKICNQLRSQLSEQLKTQMENGKSQ
jgi:hypothetical protein